MRDTDALVTLLERTREDLLVFVRARAGRLLRRETAEDLVHGIAARALDRGAGTFEARGSTEDLAWLYTVARSYLADRHAFWAASKRRDDGLLRITRSGVATSGSVPEPRGDVTGPATSAARHDALEVANRALELLLPRDRRLVEWEAAGVDLREQACLLGVSYAAAKQARHRALRRFADTFSLVVSRQRPAARLAPDRPSPD